MLISFKNLPEIIQITRIKTPQITVGDVAIGRKKNMPAYPDHRRISGLIFFNNSIFAVIFL